MRVYGFTLLIICGAIAIPRCPAHAVPQPAAAASTTAPVASRGPGILWETSLATARTRAARTGKPLLLLHLFGRLDEEFC